MREVTMRTALIKSLNVVTVDLAMRTGLARVAALAESFGLQRPEPYPSLALGTTEATPLEVAAAYTAFVNGGQRIEPRVIARATDAAGADLISLSTRTRQVIKPTTAYMITDMLSDVIDHGTARTARGAVKKTAIAGKTGTSRDGWFVGYTPNLVCVVWIGFDDNKQLGLTGADAALPAWVEFVKGAVELRPELGGEAFKRPAGITTYEIDPETGMLATDSCPQRERVALTTRLAPHFECFTHRAPVPLIAWGENTELSGAPITEDMQTDNAQPLTKDASASTRLRQLPRAEKIEIPSLSPTSVEINRSGQPALTNEMRVNTSGSRP